LRFEDNQAKGARLSEIKGIVIMTRFTGLVVRDYEEHLKVF